MRTERQKGPGGTPLRPPQFDYRCGHCAEGNLWIVDWERDNRSIKWDGVRQEWFTDDTGPRQQILIDLVSDKHDAFCPKCGPIHYNIHLFFNDREGAAMTPDEALEAADEDMQSIEEFYTHLGLALDFPLNDTQGVRFCETRDETALHEIYARAERRFHNAQLRYNEACRAAGSENFIEPPETDL